jgi:hypothetical protein
MEVTLSNGSDPGWDGFVWEASGGTIFHTLRFLGYHPPGRFEYLDLSVKDAGSFVCVLPGGKVGGGGPKTYASPLGASFGGYVFADHGDLEAVCEAMRVSSEYLRGLGFRAVEITPPPACYFRSGYDALGFAMTSSGFRLVSREATAVVPLETVELAKMPPVVRRNVRKAGQSGVAVRTGRDIVPFHEVLSTNLAAKGAAPTHTVEELETLFELFPHRLQLFEAWLGSRIVGGCLTMLCNSRTALAFYICDDPDLRHFRVTESVLHSAVAWFKGQGYKYLDLGTISIDGKVNWGLARFKSKFMAETFVREKYVLSLEERP